MSTFSLVPITDTWVETWQNTSAWFNSNDALFENAGVLMSDSELGAFNRFTPNLDPSVPVSSWLGVTRQRWNKDKPIHTKVTFRMSHISGPLLNWMGTFLYASESEYWGIRKGVLSDKIEHSYNANNIEIDQSIVAGQLYTYEIDYNPARNPTTNLYVNGNLIQSLHVVPTIHPSFWAGSTCGEANSGSKGITDWGRIEVTGEPVFGSEGTAWWMGWQHSNAAFEFSREIDFVNGVGVPHFYEDAGGLTIYPIGGDWVGSNGMTVGGGNQVYPAGSFSLVSPDVQLGDGCRFNTLCLTGSTRSGGTLKVYVRDSAGVLVSDAELPGNSAGFTPTYHNKLEISLQNVTAPALRFDVQGYNPTQRTIDHYYDENEQYLPVPNTGPPLLQSLTVTADHVVLRATEGAESATETGFATTTAITANSVATSVLGVEATTETGQASAVSSSTAQAAGAEVSVSTGAAGATTSTAVSATGLQAGSETGSATAATTASTAATGAGATAETGQATAAGSAAAQATGAQVTGEAGQAAAATTSSATVSASGLELAAESGIAAADSRASPAADGTELPVEAGAATASAVNVSILQGRYLKINGRLYALKTPDGRIFALR